jgi:hypothetical protein
MSEAAPSEQMRFDKLALFSGRPLYWTTCEFSGLQHAQQLTTLFSWCASVPFVPLGIYTRGRAQVIANVSALLQGPRSEVRDQLLSL